MTSQAKIEANRRNAMKSTGPKSVSGKQISAMNSRKHGMTTQPDPKLVLAYFRAILSDESADPHKATDDPRAHRALELPSAEARLDCARRLEASFLSRVDGYFESLLEEVGYYDFASDGYNFNSVPLLQRFRSIMAMSRRYRSAQQNEKRQYALRHRYITEAENAYNAALSAWIICEADNPETKPNAVETAPETKPNSGCPIF